MSYMTRAAGDNARGVQANIGGPKVLTTMKDFLILSKIGKCCPNLSNCHLHSNDDNKLNTFDLTVRW